MSKNKKTSTIHLKQSYCKYRLNRYFVPQYFIQVKIITHSIFLANRNIIKNFKGVGNLKPHRNLSIFHEASI